MPDIEEVNSSLGALEAQLEELSRLKDLVESLSAREEAALDAIDAAEQAVASGEEVVGSFRKAAQRIEEAEVTQRVEQLSTTLTRLQSLQEDLEEQVGSLPEGLEDSLEEHLENMTDTLKRGLNRFDGRLDQAENSLGVLQNSIEEDLEARHRDAQEALSTLRDEGQARGEKLEAKLENLAETVGSVHQLLEEARLDARLDTLRDTASNANQAAQTSLSRLDSLEQSLSDKLRELRRVQDRRSEQIDDEIGRLRSQLKGFETFTRRFLWVFLMFALVGLALAGGGIYLAL